MATAELIAQLFHWEGWSQRRIAAFLGWLKPTDDWSDPKTKARIEQRVRRWLRIGESALAITAESVNLNDDDDDDKPTWKSRPAHLEAVVRAEERKNSRR